jgi:hypothetical protein
MVRAATIAAIVALAMPVRADDRSEWKPVETWLEVSYAALHLVDWSQTLWFIERPMDTRRPPPVWDGERNPVLGRHPRRSTVNIYMAGTLALHTAVSLALPRPYRSVWQCLTVGVEASVVGSNYAAGVKMSF